MRASYGGIVLGVLRGVYCGGGASTGHRPRREYEAGYTGLQAELQKIVSPGKPSVPVLKRTHPYLGALQPLPRMEEVRPRWGKA